MTKEQWKLVQNEKLESLKKSSSIMFTEEESDEGEYN